MTSPLNLKQIAATNPAVDTKKIEQAQAIRQIMEKAGVMKKANYRLSPPLGIGPVKAPPTAGFVLRTPRST